MTRSDSIAVGIVLMLAGIALLVAFNLTERTGPPSMFGFGLVALGFVLLFRALSASPPRPQAPGPKVDNTGRAFAPSSVVGTLCAECGERIPSVIHGKFCEGCAKPIHDVCAEKHVATHDRPGGPGPYRAA